MAVASLSHSSFSCVDSLHLPFARLQGHHGLPPSTLPGIAIPSTLMALRHLEPWQHLRAPCPVLPVEAAAAARARGTPHRRPRFGARPNVLSPPPGSIHANGIDVDRQCLKIRLTPLPVVPGDPSSPGRREQDVGGLRRPKRRDESAVLNQGLPSPVPGFARLVGEAPCHGRGAIQHERL